MLSEIDGEVEPSKKQTPFSVWYRRRARGRNRRPAEVEPSKKQTPFSVWYPSLMVTPRLLSSGPQRSRRLSASGIRHVPRRLGGSGFPSKKQTPFSVWYMASAPLRRAPADYSLKEADAFQRLVFRERTRPASTRASPQRSRRLSASGMRLSIHTYAADIASPQRSRRLSASGIRGLRDGADGLESPSKKQTPFSVWYYLAAVHRLCGVCPSKKQTPFSVWYKRKRRPAANRRTPSKKQTPFSVWYLFVRSSLSPDHTPSKKQTPFSVWYL